MPIIKKPDYTIFASEAKNGELTAFPNLLRGWGVTIDQTAGKPPMEWFNALQKRTDEWLTYLSQRGISEWDRTLDYPKNSVVQFDGNFYVSIKENREQKPDNSQNSWQEIVTFLGVSKSIEDLRKEVEKKLTKDQNGADIPDPALFVKNLGLGEGSALPVGVPIPWPSETPPTGWLKCNGAAFTATQYPKLALAYPALKLPDLRGEFIRGWDDGRGVDSGRTLMTNQEATSIRTAALDYYGDDNNVAANGATIGTAFNQADSVSTAQPTTARSPANGALGSILNDNSMFATQSQARNVTDSIWITFRPRNISFNYIVRAA